MQTWQAMMHQLKKEVLTLYFVMTDADTPRVAKIMALLVVIYAFSPLDLIPDFIPILGQVDDMLIVPIGVWLTLKLVPSDVLAIHRQRAELGLDAHSRLGWFAVPVILLIWIGGATLGLQWLT